MKAKQYSMVHLALIIVVSIPLLCLNSCIKPDDRTDEPIVFEDTEETEKTFSGEGGSFKLAFTARSDWNISSDASWVSCNMTSGGFGHFSLDFDVKCNENPDDRSCSIVLHAAGDYKKTIRIVQKGADALLLPDDHIEVGYEGASLEIPLKHNGTLKVDVDVPWITHVETRSMESRIVCIDVSVNPGSVRTGHVVVTSGSVSSDVTIVQHSDAIIIPENSLSFDDAASSKKLRFTAKDSWTATAVTTDDNPCKWLSLSSTSGDAGDIEISVRTAENESYDDRSCNIKILSAGEASLVAVRQKQRDALLPQTPGYLNADAGTFEIRVRSNVDYTVDVRSSWIHYLETKGLSESTCLFSVDDNDSGKTREATVIFKSEEKSETIVVHQYMPVVELSTHLIQSDYLADSYRIDASKSKVKNMTLNPGIPGWAHAELSENDKTLTVSLDENDGEQTRECDIVVSNHLGAADTLHVTQERPPRLSVSAAHWIAAGGGLFEMSVNSDLSLSSSLTQYYIVEGVSWLSHIHTTTGWYGSDFKFEADANDTGKTRTAKIEFVYNDVASVTAEIVQLASDPEILFPDPAFNEYMVSRFDSDGDGVVSAKEASEAIYIFVSNKGIESLDGIQYCSRINQLNCSDNSIESLDLSNNNLLTSLNCSYNKLQTLDLKNNIGLTDLRCADNNILELDLSPLHELKKINCDANPISRLDISGCPLIEQVDLFDVPIEEFVAGDVDVHYLHIYCHNNILKDIIVSGSRIRRLNIDIRKEGYYDTISPIHLDVSSCPSLESLSCNGVKDVLDVRSCTHMKSLECIDGELTELLTGYMPELTELSCHDTRISSLDMSNFPNLTTLDCTRANLSVIDLSGSKMLTKARIKYNPFNKIVLGDFNGFEYDKMLNLENGGLCESRSLTIESTCLDDIHVYRNQLESLDVSGCPNLEELNCHSNNLKNLDISANHCINHFACLLNPLESLDIGDLDIEYWGHGYHYDYLGRDDFEKYGTVTWDWYPNIKLSPTVNSFKIAGTKLTHLCVYGDNLKVVDISGCPNLNDYDFSYGVTIIK